MLTRPSWLGASWTRAVVAALLVLTLAAVGASADTLQKSPNHIYICTFNIYILGNVEPKYKGSGETGIPQRIKNLADVLAVGAFDLIVIEEVKAGEIGEWAISDLATELRTTHGLAYTHFVSDPIGPGFQITEAIAFLYDPDVVKPEIIPGHTGLTDLIELPGRGMIRTQWTAGDFDFTLIGAHLIYSNEAKQDTGYMVIEEALTATVPSSYSLDPDIIILGDFNRFGEGFNSVRFLDYQPGDFLAPNVTFFDPDVHEIKKVTQTRILGKGVPGDNPDLLSSTVSTDTWVYDMFLLTPDVAEEFPPGSNQAVYGVDFGVICYDAPGAFGFHPSSVGLTHNKLKAAFSDHRPLWMRFRTNAGKSDNAPSGPGSPPVAALSFVGTQSGKKFHLPGCRTIGNSNITMTWATREEALSERTPCGVCKP